MAKEQSQPLYDEDDLNKLRKEVLGNLWKELLDTGGWVGRTYGRKGKGINSPLRGSHITLGKGNEVVILNVSEDGKLQLHEFVSNRGTNLGNQIISLLEENGWVLSEDDPKKLFILAN